MNSSRVTQGIIIFIALSFTLIGLFFAAKYTGYAGAQVTADGGFITELIITQNFATEFWQGFYGRAGEDPSVTENETRDAIPGQVSLANVFFDCLEPNIVHEVYMSPNASVDFDNIIPGTPQMLDDFLNISVNQTDSATNTFIHNMSILLGQVNISAIPAAHTFVNGQENSTFQVGILNASNAILLVAVLVTPSTVGYSGATTQYQALVPVPNATIAYYFFRDPNDVCPDVGGGIFSNGTVVGYIDNTTDFLPGVFVSVNGVVVQSNGTGFYNATVAEGNHNLLGTIIEYDLHISNVTVNASNTTVHNFTMTLSSTGINGSVAGNVTDSTTSLPIPNVSMTISGNINNTNDSGAYALIAPAGTHLLGAFIAGYDVGVVNTTITEGVTTFENFSLSPTSAFQLDNGTFFGNITDNTTGLALANVTVSVAGVNVLSNGTGFYNITAVQGVHNLVAVVIGYEPATEEITILPSVATALNLSLNPFSQLENPANGSLTGTVTVNSSTAPISNATVSLAGQVVLSNTSGAYFVDIPSGVHNIIAIKTGFDNFIGNVTVTPNNLTFFNISMITAEVPGTGVGPGVGPGIGPGVDAGRSDGEVDQIIAPVIPQIEQPIEALEFEISIKRILRKIKVGNFLQIPIGIKNNKDGSLAVEVSVTGEVETMITLDKDSFIIPAKGSEEFQVTIFGLDLGVFNGTIRLTGDVDQEITVDILVFDKERQPIEALLLKLSLLDASINQGGELKYRIDLQNLLRDEEYLVVLTQQFVSVTTNESYIIGEDTLIIQSSSTLIKDVRIDRSVPPGQYQLQVKAEFIGFESIHTALFELQVPLYARSIFGVLPVWGLMAILLVFSGGTFGVAYYRRQQRKKKRYAIKVDYSQLPKEGPRSAYVGKVAETNKKVYFDIDVFQVHTLVAGSTGAGKSVTAKVLAEEALIHGASVIVFDPTAQWSGFLRKNADKKMSGLYSQYGMKLTDARGFSGNIRQLIDPREKIDITKYMEPGQITIFAINLLDPAAIDTIVANTVKQVFHANLDESRPLRLLIIFDEVHRLLPKFGGSGRGFLQIERAAREFRKWGVGLILISQVLTDFAASIKANINTDIQMRTRDEGDLKRIEEAYGADILRSLVKAGVGTGMVENANYNNGKPFFVSFRPLLHHHAALGDDVLANYNKYNDIIDGLEYQLAQLNELHVDIFDLKLEIKLAKDKLRSGNFNMVNIYLEGLRPNIQEQWKRLGKTPKKFEKQYYAEEKEPPQPTESKKPPETEAPTPTPAPAPASEDPEPATASPPSPAPSAQATPAPSTPPPVNAAQSVIPSTQPIPPDMLAQLNALVQKANSMVAAGSKDDAKQIYTQIQQQFTQLPAQSKQSILPACMDLRSKLS